LAYPSVPSSSVRLALQPASHHTSSFPFNDTATTEIYTLSLHDALPILIGNNACGPHGLSYGRTADNVVAMRWLTGSGDVHGHHIDRKSTRLNSSHVSISYAVFCLKKKKQNTHT